MTDDEVRTLLEDAVADVQPRPALAAIRSRTATRRRRSWAWGAGGVAVATAATVAAVVALTHQVGGATTPAPAGQQAGTGPVVLTYLAGQAGPGLRLFPEPRATSSRAAALTDAVTASVLGAAGDPDHRTLWPSGTSVDGVERRGAVVVVDLSGPVARRPAGLAASAARLALQQVVLTADQAVGARLPVVFLVDGDPRETVLGQRTAAPVAATLDDATVTPVAVLSPADGATVGGTFTVTGRASTFEGTVQWELVRGGTVVRRGYTTARQCCRIAPYSFRVTAPPGGYTLVVHDEDVSDGEGAGVTRDTKRVTVR